MNNNVRKYITNKHAERIIKAAASYAKKTTRRLPGGDTFTRALIFCEAARIAADGGYLNRANVYLDIADTLSKDNELTDHQRGVMWQAWFDASEFINYCDDTRAKAARQAS